VKFILRIIQLKIKPSYIRQYSDLTGNWTSEESEFDSKQKQEIVFFSRIRSLIGVFI